MLELAQEFTKPLSIICQQSWLTREVPDNQSLSSVMPICMGLEGESGKWWACQAVKLTLVLGKVMKQINLSAVIQHIQDYQGIRTSQHGFRKGRSCSTTLMSFYGKLTCLVGEGKAVHVFCLVKSLTLSPTTFFRRNWLIMVRTGAVCTAWWPSPPQVHCGECS